jgi:flagellar basal-body rod modification protein FlgD
MSVMGTKFSTKTWSDAPQNEIQKSSGVQTISATDKARFEDQNVGEVLNKIADPNWVDPSKKMRAVGSDKMDKDAFMKLMLAQMKNQDPTNPLKSHEMAAQLAQFSSLEQMQNMNNTLTEMRNGQKPSENFQALNFIGKAVSGDSARLTRVKGDKEHDFNFDLPDDAKAVQIKVRNQEGEIVRKIDLKDLKKGQNKFTWNGQDERGTNMPTGDYQFIVEATTATSKKLAVKTDFDGIISGVNYSAEGPVLLVGNQSVKLKDVKKIVDPSLMKNGQNLQQDLKNSQVQGDTESKDQGAKESEVKTSVLDNVGMSRDMITKVAKEIKPDAGKQESKK